MHYVIILKVQYSELKKLDLVILAGGKGSRIRKYSPKIPKPLVKFKDKNFLGLLLNSLCRYNFNNVYILCGYRGNQIKKVYDLKKKNFVNIKCIIEKRPMGTGGCLNQLKKYNVNDFVLVNGDTFLDIDFKKFLKIQNKNSICKLMIMKRKTKDKLNNLNIKNNKIFFDNKNNYINCGIYFFKKEILKNIKNKFSLENDILPNLIKENKVEGQFYNDFFIDIGTPKNLKMGKRILPQKLTRPAIFLDRDGVINEDLNYVGTIKRFKFRTGVIKALKFLYKKKIYIFIVTNQAGIAKKKFTLTQFIKLQKYLKKYLSDKEILIDNVEYCPHHPEAKIKKLKMKCKCRKPSNLMVQKIFKNWFIDKKKSFMIGDQIKDEICAKNSNLYFEFAKQNLYLQVYKICKKFKI